jgi:hypothetical protein
MNILINEVFKNGATKVYVDLVVKNKKNDFISRFYYTGRAGNSILPKALDLFSK